MWIQMFFITDWFEAQIRPLCLQKSTLKTMKRYPRMKISKGQTLETPCEDIDILQLQFLLGLYTWPIASALMSAISVHGSAIGSHSMEPASGHTADSHLPYGSQFLSTPRPSQLIQEGHRLAKCILCNTQCSTAMETLEAVSAFVSHSPHQLIPSFLISLAWHSCVCFVLFFESNYFFLPSSQASLDCEWVLLKCLLWNT